MSNNDKLKYVILEETLNAGTLVQEVPEARATHVLITKQDYHGLQKALQIVRDRSVQQVKKSETDEHGYQLLRAERRPYGRTSYPAWLISRRTPYSVHMGLPEATEMITRDLHDFYRVDASTSGLSPIDLLSGLDKSTDMCAGEIARLSMDISRGVYEVAYWATHLR